MATRGAITAISGKAVRLRIGAGLTLGRGSLVGEEVAMRRGQFSIFGERTKVGKSLAPRASGEAR